MFYVFCRVQFQSALTGRRKLEVDLQALQQEHEELQTEMRGCADKVKKAGCEVRLRTPPRAAYL